MGVLFHSPDLPSTVLILPIPGDGQAKLIWMVYTNMMQGRLEPTVGDRCPFAGSSHTHKRTPITVLTGPDVVQICWSEPTCYHYAKPPTCI